MQTRVDEQSPQTFQARLYVGQVALVSGVVVGSVWFATQWTAAELGYQAALGSVWHHLPASPRSSAIRTARLNGHFVS